MGETNTVAPVAGPNDHPIMPLTFGQKAVGITFNPSGDERIDKVKKLFAEVIDVLGELSYGLEGLPTQEIIKKAVQETQTAQMRAVKAITWKE